MDKITDLEYDIFYQDEYEDKYGNIRTSEDRLESILFDMSSEEYMEDDLQVQLTEELFSDKNNLLETYFQKYKMLKENYKDNEDFISKLKEAKDSVIITTINELVEKYDLILTDDIKYTKKAAKNLYKFFVVDYRENLVKLIINTITNDKKYIVGALKQVQQQKKKDLSTQVNKTKYSNQNEFLIMNNIKYILFNIIPELVENNYYNYILNSDDTTEYNYIKNNLEELTLDFGDDSIQNFIYPFITKQDGWSEAYSDIVMELNKIFVPNEVNIIEEE